MFGSGIIRLWNCSDGVHGMPCFSLFYMKTRLRVTSLCTFFVRFEKVFNVSTHFIYWSLNNTLNYEITHKDNML